MSDVSSSPETTRDQSIRRQPQNAKEIGGVVKRHSWVTRLWHWVNLLCLTLLLLSGLQIFNAHPALYWGQRSAFAHPWLRIGEMNGPNGHPMGVTDVFGHNFTTTGVLGVSSFHGHVENRGFPAWMTLPSSRWLAMGRHWHFFAAWIYVSFLTIYLLYSLISRRRRSLIAPKVAEFQTLPATVVSHAKFKFHHARNYNILQKLTYLIVLFVLLPLMVLTGLTMSPSIDAAWPWLLTLFDGRQSARSIHFICAFALLSFFIVHVLLVLFSGVFNNLRSMITGGYRVVHDADGNEIESHE